VHFDEMRWFHLSDKRGPKRWTGNASILLKRFLSLAERLTLISTMSLMSNLQFEEINQTIRSEPDEPYAQYPVQQVGSAPLLAPLKNVNASKTYLEEFVNCIF